MQSLLFQLHTLLSAVSLPTLCVVLSTLFLGWLCAHLTMQYAEMLHRPAPFAAPFGWLCGLPMTLLALALLADTILMHNYASGRTFGLLVLVMFAISAIGQRLCRAAANRHLVTVGHADMQSSTTLARPQKSRGS
jgi:hypothetical protein